MRAQAADKIPLSSLLLVGIATVISVWNVATSYSKHSSITTSESEKSSFVSLASACTCRFLFASVIFSDCLFAILYGKWEQKTEYEKGSKLQPITLEFRGYYRQPASRRSVSQALRTMSSCTMVSWALLGLSFFFSGWSDLARLGNDDVLASASATASAFLWQSVAPIALLVSTVVKYVLWPSTSDTSVLRHRLTLLEHNGNTIMVLADVLFLGRRTYSGDALSVSSPSMLFGSCYALLSWIWRNRWAPRRHGPQYIYPFLDTSLPGWKTTLYLTLLLLVMTFFALALHWSNTYLRFVEGAYARLALGLVIVLLTCRWRD